MTTRDWFGIGLRVVGVLLLVYGAAYLQDSLLLRLGYFNHPESGPGYYLINGLFHLVVGLYFIHGAPAGQLRLPG